MTIWLAISECVGLPYLPQHACRATQSKASTRTAFQVAMIYSGCSFIVSFLAANKSAHGSTTTLRFEVMSAAFWHLPLFSIFLFTSIAGIIC